MAKKDFSSVNTGSVYGTIQEATADPAQGAQEPQEARKERKTYTEAEQERYRQEGRTMGRKGCKAIRINMAFTPEVHEYIKTMARVRGESITEFTNAVFARHMLENAQLYAQAQAFKDRF